MKMNSFSVSFKDFVESISSLPTSVLRELRRKAESFYKQPEWCEYDPFGMYVVGLLRHACSSENLTRFYRHLKDFEETFRDFFAFEKIPPYSTIAHLFNTRIARRACELVDEGAKMLERVCAKAKIALGETISTDGKKVESTHKEAKYNPHYEKKMYKGLATWDLDLLVPLKTGFADGVADERSFGRESFESLRYLEVNFEVLDGGYYSFVDYAIRNQHHYALIYFPENENGSENPEQDLLEEYRKHWKDEDYDICANVKRQLDFLFARGEFEAVGRFYRDYQIRESKECPVEYEMRKHHRSLVESGNSLLDNRGLAERAKHASFKQAERDFYWTCHVLQVQKIIELTR